MAHQILPLRNLDVPQENSGPNDHGFALQAKGHGKKNAHIASGSYGGLSAGTELLQLKLWH